MLKKTAFNRRAAAAAKLQNAKAVELYQVSDKLVRLARSQFHGAVTRNPPSNIRGKFSVYKLNWIVEHHEMTICLQVSNAEGRVVSTKLDARSMELLPC